MDALNPDDPQWVGPYRLEGRLGEGGMGSVFLGTSPGGRQVAVKLIKRELASAPQFRERFAREVEAARRVGGFHTAQVVDADPEAESPWLVTAFIPGPTLHDVVATDGALAPDAVLRLGAGLAEGLAAIHKCGLVHRDLKPGNVILASDGPRIIDFGIARAVDASSLTATGTIIGTYSYMSPEQIRADRAGAASDVFSLGSVLAFAATGHGPFDAPTLIEVVQRILDQPPVLDGVGGGDGGEEGGDGAEGGGGEEARRLHALLTECLAKDPAARPPVTELPARFAGRASARSTPPSPVHKAPVDPRVPARPTAPPPGDTDTEGADHTVLLASQQPRLATVTAPDRPGYAPQGGGPDEPTRGVSRRTLFFAGLGVAAAAGAGAFVLTRRDDSDSGANAAGKDPDKGTPDKKDPGKKDPGKNTGDTGDGSAAKGSIALKGLNTARALAFSADGKSLCGTGSNGVCRWDVDSKEGTPVHIGMPGYLQPTVITQDLKYVVRAEENKIRVWNTETGKLVRTFTGPGSAKGQDGWATDIGVSPDGRTVVAATTKGLYVWEVSSGKRLALRKDAPGGPVAFRSDGKMLVAGRPLHLRSPNGVSTAAVKDSENAAVTAFSPDGEILAYAEQSGAIRLWNTGSHQETVKLDNPDGMIHALAFHPKGDLLASGGQDGTVRVWNTVTGKRVGSFKGPTSVEALAFSPDGNTVAAGLMSAVHYEDKDAVLLWKLT
ncbi:protein kinase [Streptomyces sp. NPDC087300]|uniref:WD40 repeat domain-containing serine/threonine protein kinase n=1 Tax=Streptomyces sp. NPDC087300 TaxID=3365780 RepID=UPI0037FC06FA